MPPESVQPGRPACPVKLLGLATCLVAGLLGSPLSRADAPGEESSPVFGVNGTLRGSLPGSPSVLPSLGKVDSTKPLSRRKPVEPAGASKLTLPTFQGHQGPRSTVPSLLGRYRLALERESRRTLDKDPSVFWTDPMTDPIDDDALLVRRAQREAEKIFAGANGRVITQIAEAMIQESSRLRSAREYVDGIRLDVMNGGNLRVRGNGIRSGDEVAGPKEAGVAASFGLVLAGNPRVEMRTLLPGQIKARVDMTLASPGVRTTFSRKLTPNLRGNLSGGWEDSGNDRWVSATLEMKF